MKVSGGRREGQVVAVLAQAAVDMLARRGVSLDAMADIIYHLQRPYIPDLTREECMAGLLGVVAKREVQYAIITGLTLDEMAEKGSLEEPLGAIVRDSPELYGVDAMLALSIVNMYGSIGLSNYGYLALDKKVLIRTLPGRHNKVNTFLDDLVAAMVAAACARIAHGNRELPEGKGELDNGARCDEVLKLGG